VRRFALKTDPMGASDPGRWGHSLANLAELWIPLLDAAQVRSVVEVGAFAGDVTRVLLDWAQEPGVRIVSIDPAPQPGVVELAQTHPELELVKATSREALAAVDPPDAVILDGDHNYYTVSEELRLLGERGDPLPLTICHDAGWPHARRDAYYSPELIPEPHRQPHVRLGHLFPGDHEIHAGGLLFYSSHVAMHEGGPRNGVLTAIEDFVGVHPELRLATIPAFFGLAVIWPRAAPWAEQVEVALEPFAGNPVLARLEANRVLHLSGRELERERAEQERARAQWLEERWRASSELLERLLASRAFTVAVWLSRLRRRGAPELSKDEIRRALGR
jgi:hypothetical protein